MRKRSVLFKQSLLAMVFASAAPSFGASILFVDDDAGLNGNVRWMQILNGTGHSISYEAVSAFGNPASPLGNYDAVIWSVGDRAYSNLTTQNVNSLTAYLNGGGSLLYAGGHNVYEELAPGAAGFIQTQLGLNNFMYNMPTFGPTTMSGSGGLYTETFTIAPWAGGYYDNMFSAFGTTTATPLINAPAGTGGGPYVAAVHDTSVYSAMTFGFDINQLTSPQQQELVVSRAVNYLLNSHSVPETSSTLVLLALSAVPLLYARRRVS